MCAIIANNKVLISERQVHPRFIREWWRMPTQILPAASLRGANRLPAGRTPTGRSNYLIWMGLLAIGRAIFRAALHFLPAGREFPPPRPSGAGDGGVADPPWMKRPIPQMLSLRAKRGNLRPLSTSPVAIASSPT